MSFERNGVPPTAINETNKNEQGQKKIKLIECVGIESTNFVYGYASHFSDFFESFECFANESSNESLHSIIFFSEKTRNFFQRKKKVREKHTNTLI